MRFATGMEGSVMLLRWLRRDIEEGDASDKPSWIQWGYITSLGEPRSWYILIRLPSYFMHVPFWRYGSDPTWHQRCLLFKERIVGGDGVWQMTEVECDT